MAAERIIVCGPANDRREVLHYLSATVPAGRVLEAPADENTLDTFLPQVLTADAIVVTVDAARGVNPLAHWQSLVALRLGVTRLIVAVTNIDMVPDASNLLEQITNRFDRMASDVSAADVEVVPLTSIQGSNMREAAARRSSHAPRALHTRVDRGDVSRQSPVALSRTIFANAFEATLVWTASQPMLQGRSYVLQRGTTSVDATIAPLKYKLDAGSLQRVPAKTLERGEIGVGNLVLQRSIELCDGADRDLRTFALRDALSGTRVGVGFLQWALRRSQNVRWQPVHVHKAARAARNRHAPCILWFTGLSGAGKSTIANLVERQLHEWGCRTYLLDGDNVRHGINSDLGFTDADRVENIRRVSEIARLMVDAGLVVLVSMISPFRAERRMARALVEKDEFMEVFVDVPLEVAEARDPKGLYRKARRGDLKNFTGVDSPYEAPEQPEVCVDTSLVTAEDAAATVLLEVEKRLWPVSAAGSQGPGWSPPRVGSYK